MKLLVCTQIVDSEDPVLGFFVRWIEELAVRTEHIEVICLKEGNHSLPSNVQVHSLGKEHSVGKLTYVYRFYAYIFLLQHKYDRVFVHMNEEYVLMGGLFWGILRKPVYMWRNHYAGSWHTRLATLFCKAIFYTSNYSFIARYKKSHSHACWSRS